MHAADGARRLGARTILMEKKRSGWTTIWKYCDTAVPADMWFPYRQKFLFHRNRRPHSPSIKTLTAFRSVAGIPGPSDASMEELLRSDFESGLQARWHPSRMMSMICRNI